MEHGLVRISSPVVSVGGVGTEHMIVGEEVLVAEILGGLSVVSDYFRVGAYLTLWESHAYLHIQPPFRNTSRIHAKEWSTQQCILEVNRTPAISTPQELSLRASVSSSLGYSKDWFSRSIPRSPPCSLWPSASDLLLREGQPSRRSLLQLSTPRPPHLPYTSW